MFLLLHVGWILVLLSALSYVEGGGSSCQDIDHDACASMAKQNPKMCSDPVLANTACPGLCAFCPVSCYNCNTTTSDVRQCNTITCNAGEMCMLRTIKTGSGVEHHTMMCGPKTICSFIGKRSMGPDVNIHCCGQDLCNAPAVTTTTLSSTSSTTAKTTGTSTTTSTTAVTTPIPATTKLTHQYWWHHSTTSTGYHSGTGCVRDIIFMIEDSTPMIPWFHVIKDQTIDLINQLDVGYHKTRVALGTFNIAGTTRWVLDGYHGKTSLRNAVHSLKPSGYMVPVAYNIAAVEHVIRSFKQGNRPHVPDVVVLLTEGHDHSEAVFHLMTGHSGDEAISQLHQKSRDVIAIAAGSADTTLLRRIATDRNHFFHINDFQDFARQNINSKVLKLICQ